MTNGIASDWPKIQEAIAEFKKLGGILAQKQTGSVLTEVAGKPRQHKRRETPKAGWSIEANDDTVNKLGEQVIYDKICTRLLLLTEEEGTSSLHGRVGHIICRDTPENLAALIKSLCEDVGSGH